MKVDAGSGLPGSMFCVHPVLVETDRFDLTSSRTRI